jgi:predicted ferric reductase
MSTQVPWHLARASGIVAWMTASLSVFWGMALSTRLVRRRGAPAWLLETHRSLAALTVLLTVIHIGALLVDSYVEFSFADVLLPFTSAWRPGAVAWGIVGMYLLVAIEVTSLLKRHIRHRLWRSVHALSFGLFAATTAHAITAGTDASNTAMQWTGLVVGGGFCFLVVYRGVVERVRPSAA